MNANCFSALRSYGAMNVACVTSLIQASLCRFGSCLPIWLAQTLQPIMVERRTCKQTTNRTCISTRHVLFPRRRLWNYGSCRSETLEVGMQWQILTQQYTRKLLASSRGDRRRPTNLTGDGLLKQRNYTFRQNEQLCMPQIFLLLQMGSRVVVVRVYRVRYAQGGSRYTFWYPYAVSAS